MKTLLFVASMCCLLAGCSSLSLAGPVGPGPASASAKREAQPEQTFVANQDYLPALKALLDRPDVKTVDVLQFSFAADRAGSAQDVLKKLAALQARGVKVRVFLEGMADVKTRNAATMKALIAAGITDVRMSQHHTVHAKAVCVNGSDLLMGSTNLTSTSMDRNNETNALIHSRAIGGAFGRYFDRLWNGEAAMMPTSTADGDTTLLTDTRYFEAAKALIRRAEHKLDVGTYFLAYREAGSHDGKVKELLDVIVERKKTLGDRLTVRFFLDNNGISPDKQQSHTQEAACFARAYLSARGVSEIHFDRYEQTSHSKYIIKDAGQPRAEVLFGSTNLYWRDLDEHHQLNVLTSDPQMVGRFAAYMDERIRTAGPMPCR